MQASHFLKPGFGIPQQSLRMHIRTKSPLMKNPPNLHQVQMFLSNISRAAARIFLLFHFCCIGLDIHSLQGKSLEFVLLCLHSCASKWNQSVMFRLRSRFCYSFRSSPLIIVTNQYQSKEASNNSDKSPMQPRKKTSKFVRATLVLFVNLLFLLKYFVRFWYDCFVRYIRVKQLPQKIQKYATN